MDNGQKGFTLIELLVVIAILAVLAAVIIPRYGRFFGAGKEEAAAAELSHIQAAMDAMMVNYHLLTVDPNGVGNETNRFDALPTKTGDYTRGETNLTTGLLENPDDADWEYLYPTYLRTGNLETPTMCEYTWVTSGWLTQVYDEATGCGTAPP